MVNQPFGAQTVFYICTTCGTQFSQTSSIPELCPICTDKRQFVPSEGQQWTTLKELKNKHRNAYQQLEPSLMGIGTEPKFAIGQRALLVRTPQGNVLWDCISLIDDATYELIQGIGGLSAIAISHPHYYSSMVEWSQAFGHVPIYIHLADRQWVMRQSDALFYWQGDMHTINESITLVHCGGHFAGGTVLHWKQGANGRGALLSGDIVQVVPNRDYVSFMYSYPNYMPLPPSRVLHIQQALHPFSFERIYGAWWDSTIQDHGKEVLNRSIQFYLELIQEA